MAGWPWLLVPGPWQIYVLCVPELEVVLSSADFEVNKISPVCFRCFSMYWVITVGSCEADNFYVAVCTEWSFWGPCYYYFTPSRWAQYWDKGVWLFVCLSASISLELHVQSSWKFLYMLPVAVAWSFFWQCCNILCTFGFVDDIVFADSGVRMEACGYRCSDSCDFVIMYMLMPLLHHISYADTRWVHHARSARDGACKAPLPCSEMILWLVA